MRRDLALSLTLLLCSTLGIPSYAAAQGGKKARESPAFAKINETREVLRALESASASDRPRLVARADALIAEVRRLDPEFDADRLAERLSPYRSTAVTPAAVAATPAAPRRAHADYHRENVGKIVFFRSPPEKGKENPADEATRFGPGDHIYGIAYLDKSFKEMTYVPNRDMVAKSFEYAVLVDGERQYTFAGYPLGLTWEEYQDTTRKHAVLNILPDPAKLSFARASEYNLPLSFAETLKKLPPGRHTIEIQLIGEYKSQASGSFEIDTTGDPAWIADAVAGLKRAKDGSARLPAPKMRNPALEATMAQALKANGWRQQVLKVIIITPDWQIHRNAFGAIEFRSLNTTVALKEPDGRCRLFEVSFKQPHAGGGRYGRTEQYGVGGNLDIACENVR